MSLAQTFIYLAFLALLALAVLAANDDDDFSI
jgi:hypothetical protein